MKRSIKPMHLLFAAAAALGTLLVGARVRTDTADAVDIVAPREKARSPGANRLGPDQRQAGSALVLGARPRAIANPGGDPFATLDWQPPPAPPPPAPPPAPAPRLPVATAPALPFGFVGMVEEGLGRPQAFLSKGDALLVVSKGDVIDNGTYRVESVSPKGIVLTYVPLAQQQTLNVPGVSQ
jgi:hypothetical protein